MLLYLWHVHVINEVDEIFSSWRTVVSSGLLLERFLHHVLQYLGSRVEVERNVGDHVVVLRQTADSIIDEHCLTGTCSTDEHHRPLPEQQQVEEVANARRLRCVHQRRLQHSTVDIIQQHRRGQL